MQKRTPPKHTQLTKKKKILLGILIPFSLIIIALALFLGLWFGCNKRKPGSSNPQKWLIIDADAIKNDNYRVASGTEIYYGPDNSDKIVLGHNDLDVKAYSDAHGGVTNFCLNGTIDFGFMVNPEMDFHLMGTNDLSIKINAQADYACGVIVGQKDKPFSSGYIGNMSIESSVNFKISSSNTSNPPDSEAYGIFVFITAKDSKLTIGGEWNISSYLSYGVYFNDISSNSQQTINGVWSLIGSGGIYGVYTNKTSKESKLTINGVWAMYGSGLGSSVVGVCINDTASGALLINGIFNINSDGDAYGVYFNSNTIGSQTTIDGVWSINSTDAAVGVLFVEDNNSQLTINGVWVIYSPVNSTASVQFLTFVSSALIMNNTQYFSSHKDSGNIFEACSTDTNWWSGTYKWNGDIVHAIGSQGSKPTGNDSKDDPTPLQLEIICDQGTIQDCNFWIGVIKNAKGDNKNVFNSTFKKALDSYIIDNDCSPIAKNWLQSIINQI